MKAANAGGENFYYILYHQEPGVAEAEYDSDPRGLLSRLYASNDTPRDPPTVTDPKRSAGGWIPRLGKPKQLPAWLDAGGPRLSRRRVRSTPASAAG